MTWEELKLDNKEAKLNAEKQKELRISLVKNYHACFKTEAGAKVISDLVNKFVMCRPPDENHPNITYKAGFANGESSLVRYIMARVSEAERL